MTRHKELSRPVSRAAARILEQRRRRDVDFCDFRTVLALAEDALSSYGVERIWMQRPGLTESVRINDLYKYCGDLPEGSGRSYVEAESSGEIGSVHLKFAKPAGFAMVHVANQRPQPNVGVWFFLAGKQVNYKVVAVAEWSDHFRSLGAYGEFDEIAIGGMDVLRVEWSDFEATRPV